MKLDFEDYTKVVQGSLIIPAPNEKLKVYPDLYDRFCSVIYMLANVGGEPDKYFITKKARDIAYIRAALCEFIGIEEHLGQHHPQLNKAVFKIFKSTNPIFHMIKLLRNYNIHLSESTLSEKSMNVTTFGDEPKQFDIKVKFIANLSAIELAKLTSARDYTPCQLEKMVECFDKEQHELGLTTLLTQATLSYSEQILVALEDDVRKVLITSN